MSRASLSRIANRLLPHPGLSLTLILVWLLLAERLSLGQLLLGAILGWSIPLLIRDYWPGTLRICKPWLLARYIALVLWDILAANLAVARIVLLSPRRVRPGFVEVPLDLKSDLAIALFANTVSLTPGTVSAYLSQDRRILVVHALDLSSPDTLAALLKRRYESPLLEIFESC